MKNYQEIIHFDRYFSMFCEFISSSSAEFSYQSEDRCLFDSIKKISHRASLSMNQFSDTEFIILISSVIIMQDQLN